MSTPEQYYPLGLNPESLKGQPALGAVKSLILVNPEITGVQFLAYQPFDHARPSQVGSDTEARKYFWLSKAEIASGELGKIAQSLPQNRVLALAGYASLGETVSPPQPELSFGRGECYYGIFPMIDYECPPSAENLSQIKKDLTERLAERFGIIVYTGNSYHYIGDCLITHYLDVNSFCGVQLQLNFPDRQVLMTDPRNIGHELSTRKRPEGKIDFMLEVPITVTRREDYRLNFVLRLTGGGIKQVEPRVVDVIYRPPISFLRIVSD